MRSTAKLVAVSIAFVLLFLSSGKSQTPISSCQIINTPGEYVLTNDIIDSSASTCIHIQADNVSLDCQGHIIDGIGSGTGIVTDGKNYLSIKNCLITEWDIGIHVLSSSNSVIFNNTLMNGRDIRLDSSSNNIISNNVLSGGYIGIMLVNINFNNSIYNNVFNNLYNVYLVFFDGGTNYWNTTLQPGTNIWNSSLGYIGGNAWFTPPYGTGFSETCVDANFDGFCDSPYVLATDNIDYLPIAKYVGQNAPAPPTATPISSCQVINTPGNYILTNDLIADDTTITFDKGAHAGSYVCLLINGSDININGNGYKIKNGGYPKYPIAFWIYGAKNVTIYNLTIENITRIGTTDVYNPANEIEMSQDIVIKNLTLTEINTRIQHFDIRDVDNIKVDSLRFIGNFYGNNYSSQNIISLSRNVSNFEIRNVFMDINFTNTTPMNFQSGQLICINCDGVSIVKNGLIENNYIKFRFMETTTYAISIPLFLRGRSDNITIRNNTFNIEAKNDIYGLTFSALAQLKSNYTVYNNTFNLTASSSVVNQPIANMQDTKVYNNTFYMNGDVNFNFVFCNQIDTKNNLMANNTFFYKPSVSDFQVAEDVSNYLCVMENIVQYNNTFTNLVNRYIFDTPDFFSNAYTNFFHFDSITDVPYITVTSGYNSINLGSGFGGSVLTAINSFTIDSNLIDLGINTDSTDFVGLSKGFVIPKNPYFNIFHNFTSFFNDAFYPTTLPNSASIYYKDFLRNTYQKYKLTLPTNVLADTYQSTVTLSFSPGILGSNYFIVDNGNEPLNLIEKI